MKRIILMTLLMCGASGLEAQKYMTRDGKITFFSNTPLENIEAFNNEIASVLDSKTGDFIFQAPMKSFKFDRALMQEHFNESYLETSKYPKAEYKGKITNLGDINFGADGTYKANTSGKLTIHGATRDVTLPGTVVVKGKSITVNSKFSAVPQDYQIRIPKIMEGKIAKQIEVTVNCQMEQK